MKQQEEEQSYLNSFLELCPELITKSSLIQDPPDAEIEIGGKNISLEISKLFNRNGEKILQEFNLVEEFKSKLVESSSNLNLPDFYATWEFDFPIDVKGRKKQILLDDIVKAVAALPKKLLESPEFFHEFEISNIPHGIKSMTILRHPSLENIYWGHEKQWMSGELRQEVLNEKVNGKNRIALSNGYYKNYNENWLLLIIENEPHSSFAGFRHEGYTKLPEWVFDRIYIMEPKWDKEIYLIE